MSSLADVILKFTESLNADAKNVLLVRLPVRTEIGANVGTCLTNDIISHLARELSSFCRIPKHALGSDDMNPSRGYH
jgi:hypothetical protein